MTQLIVLLPKYAWQLSAYCAHAHLHLCLHIYSPTHIDKISHSLSQTRAQIRSAVPSLHRQCLGEKTPSTRWQQYGRRYVRTIALSCSSSRHTHTHTHGGPNVPYRLCPRGFFFLPLRHKDNPVRSRAQKKTCLQGFRNKCCERGKARSVARIYSQWWRARYSALLWPKKVHE